MPDERGRCWPRGFNQPPSGDVQFVPMLTSFARRAGTLRQASAGTRSREPSLGRAAATLGDRPPRALGLRQRWAFRSRSASVISECPSHEVPGFGGFSAPSAFGLEALRSLCGWRWIGASPHPASGGDPASAAAASCWRAKSGDWVISIRTKTSRAPNLVALGGGFFGEFPRIAGQDAVCDFGRCFPDRLRLMLYRVPPDL